MGGRGNVVKQTLCCWPSRTRLAPAQSYQIPKRLGESQRLGVKRFPRALASHDGEHGCAGRYVVEWSEASENLERGEQGTVASDRQRYGLAS